MKTFKIRVSGTPCGWVTIQKGNIVSCSQRHKWCLYMELPRLAGWLGKQGEVKFELIPELDVLSRLINQSRKQQQETL